MIIKGIRLRTASGITRTVQHIQNGAENESVVFLRGSSTDIRDMHHDAVANDSRYSVRHWIVAPHEETTRSQMKQVLGLLAQEFAFDPHRATVVEHRKRRATTDATDVHWHVLVGEVDPASGRILRNSFDRIKHELIARISEFTFGHRFVLGKHTKTVLKGLRARKLDSIAEILEATLKHSSAPAAEAFSHSQHQEMKRHGVDLPAIRRFIKNAFQDPTSEIDLRQKLSLIGLELRAGDKLGTWIVVRTEDDLLVGALHRLAGKRRSEVNILMAQADRSAEKKPSKPYMEEIQSELDGIEQSALQALNKTIPDFGPTPAMRAATRALRTANQEFEAAQSHYFDLQSQLSAAPPVRWWCHLVGSAQRRARHRQRIEAELARIEDELPLKQLAISSAHLKEIRAARSAKDDYIFLVRTETEKHKSAQRSLRIVEEARAILLDRPDMASGGINSVISCAEERVRKEDEAASKIIEIGTGRSSRR